MKITNKILLAIVSSILIFFFINEMSNYYIELKHVKKDQYMKNKIIFDTVIEKENNTLISLSTLLANDDIVKKAYIDNNPKLLKEHLLPFWKQGSQDKLIYEIHFFKPPAKSFVNFSNFKSLGNDVSDAREDIVWVTTSFRSSVHAMMCKTYAGLRATFPIMSDDKILGGLSMGKKIDWLPKSMETSSNQKAFLIYKKDATKSLMPKYYKDFMKDKKQIGEYIISNKNIPLSLSDLNKIDFKNSIQDFKNSGKDYSLNIFAIDSFGKEDLAYLFILNDLGEFNDKFNNRLLKNLLLVLVVSLIVYIVLRSKMSIIVNKIRDLRAITNELKVNNFKVLDTYEKKKHPIDSDELFDLEDDIIDMGESLKVSYYDLEKKVALRTRELELEKDYIKKILDLTPDITLVTNGQKLLSANQRFFEFVGYDTIDEFLNEHDCICQYFVYVDDLEFKDDFRIDGKLWPIYIAEHEEKTHTAILKKDNKPYYFKLSAVYLNEEEVLVTLQDVTEIKKKDKLLYEQSKMASMGEMIGNIAHQWRQPLSVISTCATGMKMQKEFDNLNDEKFYESCELINDHAQYLSKTIDDFRNFIRGQRDFVHFNLKSNITSFLNLVDGAAKAYNIDLILDLKDDIEIKGYPNELIQCFINIFNNSKDILADQSGNRVVFIETRKDKNKTFIIFKDNAGGIPSDVINSIFDPYFTTKHQKQGTGLGLHMTYKLIVEGMSGNIEAKNVDFEYKDEKYTGAKFIITLPKL